MLRQRVTWKTGVKLDQTNCPWTKAPMQLNLILTYPFSLSTFYRARSDTVKSAVDLGLINHYELMNWWNFNSTPARKDN